MAALLQHGDDLAQRIEQIVKAKYPASVARVYFRADDVLLVLTHAGGGANFPLGPFDKLQHLADDELSKHILRMTSSFDK
jgi:hypothetical protein